MKSPVNHEPWWRELVRPPAPFVIAVFLAWWAIVAISGGGFGVGGPWDFSVTGQLGDSFGILSSLMASLAAIFTYRTLAATRRQTELAELEADNARQATYQAELRAKAERARSDQHLKEQEDREHRRDNEHTFFRLLEMRNRVLGDLHSGKGELAVDGTDAAGRFLQSIKNMKSNGSAETYQSAYKYTYNKNENDLGHYFRTTYHIVRFVDERFADSEAYDYARILRAQLSNAELNLIALNCWYGEGVEKFAPLVVKYALLHNINAEDRRLFQLDRNFGARAFDPKRKLEDPPLGQPLQA